MAAAVSRPVVCFYRDNSYFGTDFGFIALVLKVPGSVFFRANPKGAPHEDSLTLASLVRRPIKIEFQVSDKEENRRRLLSLRYSAGGLLLRKNTDSSKAVRTHKKNLDTLRIIDEVKSIVLFRYDVERKVHHY